MTDCYRIDYCLPCSGGYAAFAILPRGRGRPGRGRQQQSARGQHRPAPSRVPVQADAVGPAERRRWAELYAADPHPRRGPTPPSPQLAGASPPVVAARVIPAPVVPAPVVLTPTLIPPPADPVTVPSPLPAPVSLKQLAEDASVLLELFSRSSPADEAGLSAEHHLMISNAATAISAIETRFRQRSGESEPVTRPPEADCIICYSAAADRVFTPCHHLVVCTVCIYARWGGGGG